MPATMTCPVCGADMRPCQRRLRYTCTREGCGYSLIQGLLWEEGDDDAPAEGHGKGKD